MGNAGFTSSTVPHYSNQTPASASMIGISKLSVCADINKTDTPENITEATLNPKPQPQTPKPKPYWQGLNRKDPWSSTPGLRGPNPKGPGT